MRGTRIFLAGLALAVLPGALARGAEEQIVRDAQGRIVQRITEEGLAIWYRYDATGRIVEERRSDGRRVRDDERAPVQVDRRSP